MQNEVLTSIDPRPLAPQVAIFVYQGYLGLDSGIPQSVYSLDREPDRPRPADQVAAANLRGGGVDDAARRHDGHLHRLPEFAALQLSHDPGQVWVLGSAVSLLLGLLGMLLLRRERVFARVARRPRRRRYRADAGLAHAGQRRERARGSPP